MRDCIGIQFGIVCGESLQLDDQSEAGRVFEVLGHQVKGLPSLSASPLLLTSP